MKKSIQYYMRVLHRDIGFFVIALTIIYCLSGIILTYKHTNFLKSEKTTVQQIAPNLPPAMIGKALNEKGFRIVDVNNGSLTFIGRHANGTYNAENGELTFVEMRYPYIIDMFNALHKTRYSNKDSGPHVFTVVYSILLLFLAVSSFFMYKKNSKILKRGIIISILGVVASFLMMIPFM